MRPSINKHTITAIVAALALAAVWAGDASAQTVPKPPRPPRPPRVRTYSSSDDNPVSKIDTIVPFSPNGTVELSLIAGSMRVSTWDRNSVHVVASTNGDGPSLDFDASSTHINLEQNYNGRDRDYRSRDGGTVTYEVTVPAGVRASLSAVSGSITVSGVHGSLDVTSVSGEVGVRDAGQTVAVEGVSGSVSVTNVTGDVRAEAVSGAVTVQNVGGNASAETVSGRISLTGVRGTRVRANTVSGTVDYTGSINPSGRYDFDTHSGTTSLRLAGNVSATISVDTFSGSVRSDYPGAVRKQSEDEDNTTYNYTIGRGDARVRISTFSGRVMISQENH